MTFINNFDTNSEGVNLELSAFYDIDMAREDFQISFDVIQWADLRNPSILVFKQWGNYNLKDWSPCNYDSWDLSGITVKGLIDNFIQYVVASPEMSDYRDILTDLDGLDDILPIRLAEKGNVFNGIREYMQKDDFIDFLEGIAAPTYAEVKSLGYSQGDVSYVYIPSEIISSYEGQSVDTIGDYLMETLRHLMWDAPICAQLTINGDDVDLTDYLQDSFRWDVDGILNASDLACALDEYGEEAKAIILNFLESNLPRELDYK